MVGMLHATQRWAARGFLRDSYAVDTSTGLFGESFIGLVGIATFLFSFFNIVIQLLHTFLCFISAYMTKAMLCNVGSVIKTSKFLTMSS